MHQPLEPYLRRVRARLKSLPAQEQQQHIEEIEQHLQRLIVDKRATGLSEAEATRVALEQFGNPSRVGGDIEHARFGRKTGLVKGFLLGAGFGVLLFALPIIVLSVISIGHLRLGSLTETGSFAQVLVMLVLSGGSAGVVGRRFTRRYLTRPAAPLPIFTWASQSLTVASRFLGVGMLRGAVGGALFAAIQVTLLLRDPHSTVAAASEMMTDVVTMTLSGAMGGAMIIGFLGAVVGLVLGSIRRSPVKRPTT